MVVIGESAEAGKKTNEGEIPQNKKIQCKGYSSYEYQYEAPRTFNCIICRQVIDVVSFYLCHIYGTCDS